MTQEKRLSLQITAAAFVVAAVSSFSAAAQDATNQGYLVDTQGRNAIVRSLGADVCVRTSDWTPARAVAECDPDLAKKPEKPGPTSVLPARPAEPATKPRPASPKPEVKKAEPARLLPQKVQFAADVLFDFDRATLRAGGRERLDEFARLLQGAEYEVILAIGHADRIGSAAYNRKLSLRRAEAVKQYLAGKGIAATRVTTEGKGESRPVTRPETCAAKRGKALIACLQPDRRVDVEVSGTKSTGKP